MCVFVCVRVSEGAFIIISFNFSWLNNIITIYEYVGGSAYFYMSFS